MDQYGTEILKVVTLQLQDISKTLEQTLKAAEDKGLILDQTLVKNVLNQYFTQTAQVLDNHLEKIQNPKQLKTEKAEHLLSNLFTDLRQVLTTFKVNLKSAVIMKKNNAVYQSQEKLDDFRLMIKNSINAPFLKISQKIQKIGEKMAQHFALEEKQMRIHPNELLNHQVDQEKITKQGKKDESQREMPKEQVTKKLENTRIQAEVAGQFSHEKMTHAQFKQVVTDIFKKRVNYPTQNWAFFYNKTNGENLTEAFETFVEDVRQYVADYPGDKATKEFVREQYYDYFFEGGREAFDLAQTTVIPAFYNQQAMDEFTKAIDHVMQQKQQAKDVEVPQRQKTTEVKSKPRNKFEERVAKAKEKRTTEQMPQSKQLENTETKGRTK